MVEHDDLQATLGLTNGARKYLERLPDSVHVLIVPRRLLLGSFPGTLGQPTREVHLAGLVYYFKTGAFPIRSTVIAPGVDLLAEKRAVTLPPSVHASGMAYTWRGTICDIAGAPPWLLDRVRPAEPLTPVARPPSRPTGNYAAHALACECDAVRRAAEGTRNNTLNAAAFSLGQLVGAGLLAAEDVELRLHDAACACGLSHSEARATIASGLHAGVARPRVVGPRRAS